LQYVELRLYGDLSDFADADRGGVVTVPVGEPRSVKDAVESVGVPHVEVDLLLVDGEPSAFDRLVRGGERVAVYPPFSGLALGASSLFVRPEQPVRFVLDVHLGTLARRLRLLGFDSWWRNDADDTVLVSLGLDEGRVLLTRDRELLMRRDLVHGYCPRSDDPNEQAREVLRRFELAEAADPFTRCVVCNGRLVDVQKAAVLEHLPPRTRVEFDEFRQCQGCGKVYWPGSHVDAMNGIVEQLTG
jgi:uncharacterized protein with PIN domain